MNLIGLITAGMCFGFWPIIMRKSDLPGTHQPLLLTIPTSVIILAAYLTGVLSGWVANALLVLFLMLGVGMGTGMIATTPYLLGAIAGLLNGIGTIKFLEVLKATPKAQTSSAFLVVILTQIVISDVGGMTMLDSKFSIRKAIGFGMAIASAYVIVTSNKQPN